MTFHVDVGTYASPGQDDCEMASYHPGVRGISTEHEKGLGALRHYINSMETRSI